MLQKERLLHVTDASSASSSLFLGNFQEHWAKGLPIVASKCNLDMDLWRPDLLYRTLSRSDPNHLDSFSDAVTCRRFWEGFEKVSARVKHNEHGLVTTDARLSPVFTWGSSKDEFRDTLPHQFQNLAEVNYQMILSLEFVSRTLSFVSPVSARTSLHVGIRSFQFDFSSSRLLRQARSRASSSCRIRSTGHVGRFSPPETRRLWCRDAPSVCRHSQRRREQPFVRYHVRNEWHSSHTCNSNIFISAAEKYLMKIGCGLKLSDTATKPGVVWHVFERQHNDVIEKLIVEVCIWFESGVNRQWIIHSQLFAKKQMKASHDGAAIKSSVYLNVDDLKLLKRDRNVEPITVVQHLDDAVFIPTGCYHQVGRLKCNSVQLLFFCWQLLSWKITIIRYLLVALHSQHRLPTRHCDGDNSSLNMRINS